MIPTVFTLTIVLLATQLGQVHSFRARFRSLSSMYVQRATLFAAESDSADEEPKKKFGLTDLVQLVTMGAGAPSLGEYKRTDESGRMIFELEANNFADDDGNSRQLKGKFFNEGYVENDFEDKPPGFWANLMSGGELQRKWDDKNRASK